MFLKIINQHTRKFMFEMYFMYALIPDYFRAYLEISVDILEIVLFHLF